MCVRHGRGQAAIIGGDSVARQEKQAMALFTEPNVHFTTIQYCTIKDYQTSKVSSKVLMVFRTIETSGYRRAPRAALLRFIISIHIFFPSFLLQRIFETRVYAYTELNYL